MTFLLIAGGWLVAAVLTAGLFAVLARAGRQPEPAPDLPMPAVQLPLQRSAPTEVRRLESQR